MKVQELKKIIDNLDDNDDVYIRDFLWSPQEEHPTKPNSNIKFTNLDKLKNQE